MSLILYALTCIVVFSTSTEARTVSFQDVPTDISDNIYLHFFYGSTITDFYPMKLKNGLAISTYDGFDVGRETVFLFHGWGEDPGTLLDSGTILGSAFLQVNTSNLVIIDYAGLVKSNHFTMYPNAVFNASYIGTAIGQYLQQYVRIVQLVDKLHLVSFSIGSQIMSKAARTYGAGLLPWLTALDPAGPWYNLPTVAHLSRDDGMFVDVVHTDAWVYGDFRSVGTVDFFPNSGIRVQPACYTQPEYCSHMMSYEYYAEAILNPFAFPAKRCFRIFICTSFTCFLYNDQNTYMGYKVDKTAQGNFYFSTNNASPYGRGMAN